MAAGVKILVGLWVMFVVGTILSTLMDAAGYMMSGTQSTAANYLMNFSLVGTSWWSLPMIAWGFFTQGLPAMIAWDYAWLNGLGSAGEIIRWILRGGTTLIIVWSIAAWIIPGLVHIIAAAGQGLMSLARRY